MNPKPLYPTQTYKGFCKNKKTAGLTKEFWKDLPRMWKEELKFRKKLERMLDFI